MGADLYIPPLYEPQRRKWEPQFEKAAKRRDSLKPGSKEYQQAQVKVEKAYDKMYERGYFRDPYNDSDLLWKFGLSWWNDVIPLLDKQGRLLVGPIHNLLAMLKDGENVFELKLATLTAEEQQYFRRRYTLLRNFLNDAIEHNAPIDTSL